MLSLNQVLDAYTDMAPDDRARLRALVNEWHLLADTSFSDLILWVPGVDDNIFWAAAQIRPTTGPTALEDDVVGEDIRYDDEHLVTSAYLSGEIMGTSDNQLKAGIPVDTWAIPILRQGGVLAIVERHTNRMGIRAPGALEDAYLEIADILSDMLWRGDFPVDPPSDPSSSPKVGDGLIQLNVEGIITYASPNAVSTFRRLGHPGDLLGEELRELTDVLTVEQQTLGQSVAADVTGRMVREIEIQARDANARLRVIPLRHGAESAGTLVLCKDTTDIRSRERQLVTKDATIREIHHRVKNNLQTVAALLRLQSRRIESPEAKQALRDAMSRVAAIAVVHDTLSQAFDEEVAFDDVADRILHMVGEVAATSGIVVARREGSFELIPADVATSLSLVMTELCQTAVEHGLHSSSGTVIVRPQRDDGHLVLDVLDDGVGLPPASELNGRESLGLSIVRTLVTDMGGSFSLGPNPEGRGTLAEVIVSLR